MTHATLTETSLKAFLTDYAQYNRWANQRLVDWLATKPAELLDQTVPSSFPSLSETLFHISMVEQAWMGWLKGARVEIAYGQKFPGTREELFAEVLEQSDKFAQYIAALSDEALQELCDFKAPVRWPEWDDFSRPRHELILHALNHSTYHRGQITTIGRNLGLTDAPMTDHMYYNLVVR